MSTPSSSRPRLSSWWADRPVAVRLGAAVLAGCLVAGVVGLLALARLGSLAEQARALETHSVQPLQQLAEVRRAYLQTRVDALADEYLGTATGSRVEHDAYLADVEAMDAALEAYATNDLDTTQQAALDDLRDAWRGYEQLVGGELLALARANKIEEYTALRTEKVKPFAVRIGDALTVLWDAEKAGVERNTAHAEQTYEGARTTVLLLLVVGLGLSGGLATLAVRSVVRPLREVSAALDAVADGDLTVEVGVTSQDEVGRMAASLTRATGSVRDAVQAMARSASALAGSSDELTATSTTIAASAEQASAQANVVSAAAEQVSRNVQTVATGAEEMGASIREIAQNANEAARVAGSAVEVAQQTNETVSKLGDSSRQIGEVVKVITSIAEQTNLLALNATIEAARAGEAGKGFAVVANEVKELAQETAKATDDISRMIQAIQGDTAGAVDAIGQISAVIGQINDYQTTIASAVEEQTATTNEMSRSVAEAATGSTEIAANIIGVAQAAQTTSSGVVDSQRAATELAGMSSELDALVGRFRV